MCEKQEAAADAPVPVFFSSFSSSSAVRRRKVLDINDLWDSRDEREWLAALDRSWPILVGGDNPELAKSMHTVDLESVRRLGVQGWYEFLTRYFHLQFAG